MRGIIDQLVINKKYLLLAANNANVPSRVYRVGDPTCDSDGFVRADGQVIPNTILLPDFEKIDEPLYLFIPAIQAYEEQLTGIDGVGHCQISEPIDVIITFKDGNIYVYAMKFKNHQEVREILGYNRKFTPLTRLLKRATTQ
jgi:arginine decarboxylase-like protein